jgi:hypothetical protein
MSADDITKAMDPGAIDRKDVAQYCAAAGTT